MYYFIINPHSRSGYGYKVWKKVEGQLKQEGVEYRAFLTERPGQAAEFSDQLTRGCKESRVIVVIGGDGTVNEVLDGICFCSTITLGYIPAGTGEDLARSLKLPRSPLRCLRKILYPKYYKLLDYGVMSFGDASIHHRRFIGSAGIGLDASICHNLLGSRFKMFLDHIGLRRLVYTLTGLGQYFKAKPVKGYIILDGTKRVEFNYIYFISIQNHPYEGGGVRFAPKADCSDGQMEVCVVSHSVKKQVFSILFRAWLRRSHNKGMRIYPCREVQIHTERPLAVHADGESCQFQQDLEVQCIERKVRMIV